MLNFTIQPNETFNYSVLEEFCESHELDANINSDNTITLYSSTASEIVGSLVLDDTLEEAYEQLEDLIVDTASLLC